MAVIKVSVYIYIKPIAYFGDVHQLRQNMLTGLREITLIVNSWFTSGVIHWIDK